jgi:hypothetical protein
MLFWKLLKGVCQFIDSKKLEVRIQFFGRRRKGRPYGRV